MAWHDFGMGSGVWSSNTEHTIWLHDGLPRMMHEVITAIDERCACIGGRNATLVPDQSDESSYSWKWPVRAVACQPFSAGATTITIENADGANLPSGTLYFVEWKGLGNGFEHIEITGHTDTSITLASGATVAGTETPTYRWIAKASPALADYDDCFWQRSGGHFFGGDFSVGTYAQNGWDLDLLLATIAQAHYAIDVLVTPMTLVVASTEQTSIYWVDSGGTMYANAQAVRLDAGYGAGWAPWLNACDSTPWIEMKDMLDLLVDIEAVCWFVTNSASLYNGDDYNASMAIALEAAWDDIPNGSPGLSVSLGQSMERTSIGFPPTPVYQSYACYATQTFKDLKTGRLKAGAVTSGVVSVGGTAVYDIDAGSGSASCAFTPIITLDTTVAENISTSRSTTGNDDLSYEVDRGTSWPTIGVDATVLYDLNLDEDSPFGFVENASPPPYIDATLEITIAPTLATVGVDISGEMTYG